MVSKREKGREKERKCKEILENKGWLVYLIPPTMKYNKQNDIFGLFDILAVRTNGIIKERLWIQVTSNSTMGRLKSIKKFRKKYLFPNETVQLWVWISNKGFKIYEILE